MPLGDPHGGMFEYMVEGLPESVFALSIPVSSIDRAVGFYIEVLGMSLVGREGRHAFLRRGECHIALEESDSFGVDTRAFLAVDSPFNTRRRLMDEGVEFLDAPHASPVG
ncbi:MAG: VOC family protein, partial [Candidatus Methanomethylophilaceae archaeon]|nr:VOC family protein [Candidatus Methanomethylophilaceae archaeon]